MTIITKPISDKKSENRLEQPLVFNETPLPKCSKAKVGCNDHAVIDPNSDDVEAWLSPTLHRRVSTATTICVFITALLVMSIGIIGGVYLYRQFSQHQMNRYRGWCGIPYEKDLMKLRRRDPFGSHSSVYKTNDDAEWSAGAGALFKEEFDLDLEDNAYEEIRVPTFEFGRQARFIHDFKADKTGIIDVSSKRCFVMPLDHKHTMPPRTIFDLINKMYMGYYNVNTALIQQTMRVAQPPVEDYTPLGKYITEQCSTYPTYMLKDITSIERIKRSVDDETNEETNSLQFIEFAGNNIMRFTILEDEDEVVQQ